MKKMIVLLMAVFMVFGICGCKSKQVSSTDTTITNNETILDTENEKEDVPAITIDDVKQIFLKDGSFDGYEITDCVIAPDGAYEVGS